ncbi:MAG TPA: BlaI/MecI/CopY family transcriptional regulator [Holophaga sp.]|nr:BlaI/MecI/CopY family transcriptional regulator [Holophaga sp.]
MSPDPLRPSDGELAILRVLWGRGPSTVRDVHTELSRDRETGYTTVLKLMQIMAEKGLVTRDASAMTHVYQAAVEEAPTQALLVDDLIHRAFGGSARDLVVRALESRGASREDMEEIQRLLDQARKARP